MTRVQPTTRMYLALFGAMILAVCTFLTSTSLFAQGPQPTLDDNSSGTYFLVSYPDTTTNALDARYPNNRVRPEASLWIFSPVANKVKITSNGSSSEVLNLEAMKFKTHTLKSSPVCDVINSVSRRSVKIESDYPIVVYCYFAHIQSVEAWTPIAVENWGTDYYAACVPGETVLEIGLAGETEIPHTVKPGGANILVIAAYDNTKVTLTPASGYRFVGGPPATVTLNEGQVFQVQSKVDTAIDAERQDDLGASRIQSDKPIGVISGNTRVQVVVDEVGLKNNAYKNMVTEWIPPTEQHGKEFVYFPTWDNHRPGIGSSAERKREFARVYNSNGKAIDGYYLQPGGTSQVKFKIKRDTLAEFAIGQPSAVYFKTEEPAMAMMHSSAIVKFNGSTPCYAGLPCLSYDAWAPYMVEMTPREQWVSFAPHYAPVNPGSMQHYVSIVTDTATARSIVRENGSGFLLNRKIPGTDLVWGTMSVSPGEDHWLWAKNGGKFTGVAFGIMQGYEEYRPGAAKKKKDDGPKIAGGGGGGAPGVQHPCEYEEYNAVSYGYPLSPSRRVLKPADTLRIDTVMDCTTLTIRIRAINANPVGLRSITLDPTSVQNARLVPVDPLRLSDIIGRSQCVVQVEPIDPLKNAEATVIIKDRTGMIWRVYYRYEAEYVELDPATELDYGEVTVGNTITKTVIVRNPLNRPLEVKELRLALGNQGYRIVGSTPSVPTKLQPGQTMEVQVSSTPELDNQKYVDTLKVILGCTKVPLPLITVTSMPEIYVDDLRFGVFVLGRDPAKTLDLEICNRGSGQIAFDNPGDPDPTKLLSWIDANFTVDPVEIAKLKTTILKAHECTTLKVTFTPTALGDFRTVARAWANTRFSRDTSVWTARVVQPGPVIRGNDWGDQWVTTSNTCTKNQTASYTGFVVVDNLGTSDDEVESLTLVGADADSGFFKLLNDDRATTVLPGDVLRAGGAQPLRQKVLFLPKDERDYAAVARLITKGKDTIDAPLTGTGIESHGAITGANFGTSQFVGAYPLTPSVRRTVVLTAKQTRELTVTDVVVLPGPDAASFWIDPTSLAGLPWKLQPGETRSIDVEFRPQTTGNRTARIAFVGDHSRCDDSTNVLLAFTFSEGVVTQGHDFGTLLTCDEPVSNVRITNTGSDTVRIRGTALDVATPYFVLETSGINFPLDVPPNASLDVPVRFIPSRPGSFTANVLFDVINARTGAVLQAQPAEVRGSGYIVTVHTSIGSYSGAPGAVVDVPVMLEQTPEPARLKSLYVSVYYDSKVVKVLNASNSPADKLSLTNGTLANGWDITVIPSPAGTFQAVLNAPAGEYLRGTGKLVNLQFQLFLGETAGTKLSLVTVPVTDAGKQCVRIIPSPGNILIDSLCGLSLRLIESFGVQYSLAQNKPNPFNPSTEITFSLGLDGPTRLVVYDASGQRVATLVDGHMKPGTYQVTWDASGFPSGLYYYRLESGAWTRTNTMMLRK